MGNLYITLALLFSFIADTSNAMPNASTSGIQAQRRKDYGFAEGSVYIGVMLGPFLGGTVFKLSRSYVVPYWCSSVSSLVLFAGVFFFQPNDATTASSTMQEALLQPPAGLSEATPDGGNAALQLHNVVVADKEAATRRKNTRTRSSIFTTWWNPFAPFVLMFCNRDRLLWSSVLLMAWMGQKGVDFLYNPFVHYEFNRGAFLIGVIATTKALSSVVSNICCVRMFSRLKMRGETILLIGCGMLIVAYGLVGMSSNTGTGSSSRNRNPGIFFWVGVSISGLAAFVSPMIRSLVTGTVNTNSDVNPVSLLGSIAAIESFCDFAVPFVYPVAFDWLISIHKAPFIFFLGAVFYLLAGLTIVVCGKRMRRGVVGED